ncbi:hypothetical protein GLF_2476 [Gluconobacter frateurii NBRC 101659]|nr:hypothetical protein GLF_2476 [Gluconobacter frateurii NBRC 101659]
MHELVIHNGNRHNRPGYFGSGIDHIHTDASITRPWCKNVNVPHGPTEANGHRQYDESQQNADHTAGPVHSRPLLDVKDEQTENTDIERYFK